MKKTAPTRVGAPRPFDLTNVTANPNAKGATTSQDSGTIASALREYWADSKEFEEQRFAEKGRRQDKTQRSAALKGASARRAKAVKERERQQIFYNVDRWLGRNDALDPRESARERAFKIGEIEAPSSLRPFRSAVKQKKPGARALYERIRKSLPPSRKAP